MKKNTDFTELIQNSLNEKQQKYNKLWRERRNVIFRFVKLYYLNVCFSTKIMRHAKKLALLTHILILIQGKRQGCLLSPSMQYYTS